MGENFYLQDKKARSTMPFFPAVLQRLFLWVGLGLALSAHASDLNAYTEDWAPYNYEENGQVRGISTDILRAACSAAKLDCSIALVPWARAYKNATTEPKALAYTTARKPSREHEFAWVGPILPRSTWVYTREDGTTPPTSAADLAKLRIGIVRGEASEQDLLAAGVPATALIAQPTNVDVLRMLLAGGVDAMVDTEVAMHWNLKNQGLTARSVHQAFKLTEEGAYYFAINPGTPPQTVEKLQTALDKLRASGQITRITRRYLGTP